MAKAFTPKIVSANDLLSGEAIYFTGDGWDADISRAIVAHVEDAADILLARASRQADIAVGPYLVDVRTENDVPVPTKYRESLRISGPTVGALNAAPELRPEARAA